MQRLIHLLAATLDAQEREAVLGDLAERGLSGWSGLRDLAGIVVRRQLQLFQNPREWAMLIACCCGAWLLGDLCARTSNRAAVDSWLYFNNWEWTFLNDPAFRHNVSIDAPALLLSLLKLAGWSWICGFVLATVTRARAAAHAAAFFLVLFALELQPKPRHGPEAAVFALTFYRVFLPLLVKIVLTTLPCVLGMRYGLRPKEGVQA